VGLDDAVVSLAPLSKALRDHAPCYTRADNQRAVTLGWHTRRRLAGPYDGHSLRRTVSSRGLIWLTAFNLRVLLFAIPPALPQIRSDLDLSYFATGSITSLAVLTLGVASIPGALLATRYGARRLVALCAAGLALFGAAITLPPGPFWVFAGSALLTLSIAIAQPPLAVLIRRWFPTAITRAS